MRAVLVALALLAVSTTPAAAIVGGKETDKAWPWIVALEYGRAEVETGPLQQCGAALVGARWVLTAAHCLEGTVSDPRLLAVSIGRHDKDDPLTGERIQVKAIHPHELYDPSRLDGYDLALLELAAPAESPPIRIAGRGEEAAWAMGAAATALGWGYNGFPVTTYQDKLKEATFTISPGCTTAIEGFDAETSLCTLAPADASICFGDSGGPLVVPVGAEWRLVGVLAFGASSPPCEPGHYAGYDKIAASPLREWIAARVPEAFAPDVVPPPPAPPAEPAAASGAEPSPSQPAAPAAPAAERKSPRALKRCLKQAGKSKRKQRACRKAGAKVRRY